MLGTGSAPGLGVVGDVAGEVIGAGAGTPPHPKRRTVAERAKTVAKCFMSFPHFFSLEEVGEVWS
jgi:hypothetical protein